MRAIITGGAGLIGRSLSLELTQSGYEVIVLSRNPGKASGLPANTRAVFWDGRTANGWGEMVEGAEAIVNLAGESIAGDSMLALILKRWTAQRKRSIRESRLNAGRAVIEAVQQARIKPKVVIQASAVGYYGSRGDEELTEHSEPANDYLAQVCVDWEASTAQVEELGVRLAIIRTGGVALSTEGGAFPFMLLPFRFFAGGPLGNGKQWFSWIHMADEARAIRYLIENPNAHGVFNLSWQAEQHPEWAGIVADELAGAAEPVMGKLDRVPVAIIRGLDWPRGDGSSRALLRDPARDLFR